MLAASGDGVGLVPAARWSLVGHEDKLTDTQATAARHGAFVAGADRFDNRTFSISPAEARSMDPQQRMLLEIGYTALHGSMLCKAQLLGSPVGYFLGIERPDWALRSALAPDTKVTAYTVTADTISVACGRVSFSLGLHGPCMSTDTACASGLVAMHTAARSVRGGECDSGLASAVTLKLMPQATARRPRGHALAGRSVQDARQAREMATCVPRGRRAGGEQLIAGGSQAMALCGSAVRQDGRSASLTAPNGSAQRLLMLGALEGAALAPQSIAGVELHGTGTPLGDPTEVGALVGVFGPARSASLAISAAKGNVGHSEPVSGLLGLAKVELQLRLGSWYGNAQLRVVNPLLVERFGAR